MSLVEKVRELDEKYERIAKEIRRIERDLAYVTRTIGPRGVPVERGGG